MKRETRIELAVVLVGAVVIGGWIGLKVVRRSSGPVEPEPAAIGTETAETAETTTPQTRLLKWMRLVPITATRARMAERHRS